MCQKNVFTLKKHQRLLKPEDFKRVFARQQKYFYQGLVVYCLENDFSTPRLGLVVAKRHFKHAVSRNQIKRHIRESFRLNQHTLGSKDIVVVATARLTENRQWASSKNLAALWQPLSVTS